jgi:type II secretory pathway pseudopilin PulG
MNRNRGYTLIELLCVLGTIAILCTVSVPVLQRVDARSKERTDNALILVLNQAMESYRFNDYSALDRISNKKVTFEENGRVKIRAELNMDSNEIAALSNSGKGIYPQTREECLAIIKLYTGETFDTAYPAKGASYDYYYNKATGKTAVLRKSDIAVGNRGNYIILNGG